MSTKQVQDPGEHAETEDESNDLCRRIPRLPFIDGPEGLLCQTLGCGDPSPDKVGDETLRADCCPWSQSHCRRILPGMAELGLGTVGVWVHRRLLFRWRQR